MIALPTVNSFDVFDTLLARKVLNPCDIFSVIETKFPFPDFRKKRGDAQCNSNGTMDDIYVKFGEMYGVEKDVCDKLKDFEIEMEIQYSYLIQTNCNRVKDGDILISDMYLSSEQIMRILVAHGFNKKVKIYASPAGKSSGMIWPLIQKEYTIQLHLGDNEYSDVQMAKAAGIEAEHTAIYSINKTEQFFLDASQQIFAILLRQFRHMNPYAFGTTEYELYNDQAAFNIPLLLLTSRMLHNILKTENRDTLLLITRDGCLLKHIFSLLYPTMKCVELESSRNVHKNPTQEYKNYLKSVYNKDTCLIFDVYGAFCSGRELFKELFGEYPRVHLLGYDTYFKGSEPYSGLTYSSTKCFEHFNIDCKGSLLKLENGVFVRPPVIEYDINNAIIYKNTVESFCKFIEKYTDFISTNPNLLDSFINSVEKESVKHHNGFNSVQEKINAVAPLWNHQSLTTMSDILTVSKGSTVGCGHRYTEYYELLLAPWYNKECSILELGINRYGMNSTPSLDLWKAYMCNKTKIYGYDSCLELLKFNKPSDNIFIINGTQKHQTDIEKCCVNTYDCIIDDGEHDSCSQQVMFKTLWKSLKPGGMYCFESLHWQPSYDYGKKTKDLLMDWKSGNLSASYFITQDEVEPIYKTIKKIEFLPSKSVKWDADVLKHAFCVVYKND